MATLSQQNNKLLIEISKSQLTIGAKISVLENDSLKNKSNMSRILGYLESDDKTKQVGGIEQISKNTKSINELKSSEKVFYGIGAAIAAFISLIGWIINFFTK